MYMTVLKDGEAVETSEKGLNDAWGKFEEVKSDLESSDGNCEVLLVSEAHEAGWDGHDHIVATVKIDCEKIKEVKKIW